MHYRLCTGNPFPQSTPERRCEGGLGHRDNCLVTGEHLSQAGDGDWLRQHEAQVGLTVLAKKLWPSTPKVVVFCHVNNRAFSYFVPHSLARTVFLKKSVPFYSQWMLQEEKRFGVNAWIMFSFESWTCPKLSEATLFTSKLQSKIFALSLKDASFRDPRPFNQIISSFLGTEEQVLVIKSARPWPGLAFALLLTAEIGTLLFPETALSTGSCRLPFPVHI